jgi:hypothetical protein
MDDAVTRRTQFKIQQQTTDYTMRSALSVARNVLTFRGH